MKFLQQKETVYFLGRVTRNGFREALYYGKPWFEQVEVNAFCDDIMKERGINFIMERDPNWRVNRGILNEIGRHLQMFLHKKRKPLSKLSFYTH